MFFLRTIPGGSHRHRVFFFDDQHILRSGSGSIDGRLRALLSTESDTGIPLSLPPGYLMYIV